MGTFNDRLQLYNASTSFTQGTSPPPGYLRLVRKRCHQPSVSQSQYGTWGIGPVMPTMARHTHHHHHHSQTTGVKVENEATSGLKVKRSGGTKNRKNYVVDLNIIIPSHVSPGKLSSQKIIKGKGHVVGLRFGAWRRDSESSWPYPAR